MGTISSEQHRSGTAAPAAAATTAASPQHKNVCLQDFLLGFYARRLKRLQPALVFVLCATAVGLALLVPEDFYSTDLYWGTLGFGLVGMANVWLSTLLKRSEVVQQENVAREEAAPRTVAGPDATGEAVISTSTGAPSSTQNLIDKLSALPTGGGYFDVNDFVAREVGQHVESAVESGGAPQALNSSQPWHVASRNPGLHLWSLGVEEQFYLHPRFWNKVHERMGAFF